MKRAYLMSTKVSSTVILAAATFVCATLALISWPVDSPFTRIWATVFSVSAVFFLIGIVRCWCSASFSKWTLAGVIYAFVLYGYVNLVAPHVPEPFGYSGGSNNRLEMTRR